MNSTQQLQHQIGGEIFIGLFVSSVGVGIIAAGVIAPEGFQSMPFGNTIAIYFGVALLVLGAAYLRTTILLRRMRRVASPDVPSRRELRRSFAALKAQLVARDGGESCKPEGLRAGSAQQPAQARRASSPARVRHSPQQAHSTSERVREVNHEPSARSSQIGLRHRRQPTIVELNEGPSHKPR